MSFDFDFFHLFHQAKLLVTNKVMCQPEIWGQEASPSRLYHIHSKLHFVLSAWVLFGGINADTSDSDTDRNTFKFKPLALFPHQQGRRFHHKQG